ncbi:MAG TPA: NAD+ synthase [Thermoplasmata archaeon]|nr:NAD+ synthase [Thermoplasmata archaeon]
MSALTPRLPSYARETIVRFLRAHLDGPPVRRAVVGVSGGIDSALVLRLVSEAVGPSRVVAVLLPTESYSEVLREETVGYARPLADDVRIVPVDGIVAALRAAVPEVTDRTGVGNLAARARMVVLYALAGSVGGLVVGTGNKSELLLGYFTKHGDGGADLLPIGDLYKTEIRTLAADLGLPEPVLARAPTAGLYEGQTDEADLGLPYEAIDQVLRGLEELREPEEIAKLSGLSRTEVDGVVERVRVNRHKRRPAPIPKLGLRTVGLDWRD